jgi:O-antigen ligase
LKHESTCAGPGLEGVLGGSAGSPAVVRGGSSAARLLEIALRVSTAGIAGSVVALGHVTSTLPLFYAVMAACLMLYVLARGPEMFRSVFDYLTSNLMVWRWAFLIWALLSLMWTARGSMGISRAITLVEMHAVGLVFYDASRRLGLARWILTTVFIVAALASMHAIITEDPTTTAGRLTGLFANPNTLAIVGVIALAIFSSGLLASGNLWANVGTYTGAIVLLIAVLASASLKGLAGTMSVAVIGTFLPGVRRRIWTLVGGVALAMITLVSTLAPLREYWDQAVRRVDLTVTTIGLAVGTNVSFVERARFIRKGAVLMAESPLFGQGLESFRWLSGEGKYAHNNYIEIGVSLGIVGLILYYAFPLAILFSSARERNRDPDVRRFLMIAIPTLMLLDMAFVSYATKLVSLTTIMLAGWVDRRNDLRGVQGAISR